MIRVEPGRVWFGDTLLWDCRPIENETDEDQIEETTRRFAELLRRAIRNAENYR